MTPLYETARPGKPIATGCKRVVAVALEGGVHMLDGCGAQPPSTMEIPGKTQGRLWPDAVTVLNAAELFTFQY